jgi:hypothetical protein
MLPMVNNTSPLHTPYLVTFSFLHCISPSVHLPFVTYKYTFVFFVALRHEDEYTPMYQEHLAGAWINGRTCGNASTLDGKYAIASFNFANLPLWRLSGNVSDFP